MRRIKAFTLIELVVVMVILGITATATVSFLWQGSKMFVGIGDRARLSAVAHNLFSRFRIQIENAIPYSISVTDNIYSDGAGSMLSFTLPIARYRIADISDGQYVYLPLSENDHLCSADLSSLQLRYVKLSHSYGTLNIQGVTKPDGSAVSSSCAAGVYKVKVSGFSGDSYVGGGTVLYLTDGISDKKYYRSSAGYLYYQEGNSLKALNNPVTGEHGAAVDIFKLNDGTFSNGQNAVTVSVKLSSGDDFVTVSQRFELHNSMDL
ncbi:type II secretion system protein [uncultured Ruminobacter sp.]|jgi:prepilin-type N-terminal cleavage/methylation domain-containing protein|uniref:type II secretion system protein n=1 Tax=uncultured Ruminobacter sp. TaxID=538947 RepID=UPI00262081A8|nr:type II secretion system protein [uncultured Ruminobacter sp.]